MKVFEIKSNGTKFGIAADDKQDAIGVFMEEYPEMVVNDCEEIQSEKWDEKVFFEHDGEGIPTNNRKLEISINDVIDETQIPYIFYQTIL